MSQKNTNNRGQHNNKLLTSIEVQAKEDTETTTSAQNDTYDSLRGSENTSPKSCDSQSSIEDKVYKYYIHAVLAMQYYKSISSL